MRTTMKHFSAIPALAMLLGCGTMINGTSHAVGFASVPRGARVTVDGAYVGTTPVVVDLSTTRSHDVRMTLDGYEPYAAKVDRKFSVWSLVGAFPTVVPLAVDIVSGGAYTFRSEQVAARLVKSNGSP